MSIPFSSTHYRIPQGFGNLLEGLTREILREQPDNIPAFAAAYFENLLEKREKTNFDPAEWGTMVDDRFYNNHAFKEQEPLEKCEPGKEKSQTSMKEVTALHQNMRCLRSLLLFLLSENESSEEDKDMEENAALKIQAAFRGHLAREEVKKMKSSDLQEKTEENE
ncbi:sperm surface protein Sp17 isoform X1 [Balaenoptera acutorostrata]|uniref:Sperm surface protein Sp17 n=1 Tax=Balaenoptera acutorostrata TaxID=9767 RepID=A0ABM3U3Q2_BALAC|nr:sperm surface protein Sp17 isoform X1 [Balaenoptera acutorostrata]